jgi:hypothetical protein
MIARMSYRIAFFALVLLSSTLSSRTNDPFQVAAKQDPKQNASVSEQEQSISPYDVSDWSHQHYQQALDALLPMAPPSVFEKGAFYNRPGEWIINFRLVDTEWLGHTEGGFQLAKLQSGGYVASVTVLDDTPLLFQLEAIRRQYRGLNNGQEPTLGEALTRIRKRSGVVSSDSCETLGPVISAVEEMTAASVPRWAKKPSLHRWPRYEYLAISGENERRSLLLYPADLPLIKWFHEAVNEMLRCLDNDK